MSRRQRIKLHRSTDPLRCRCGCAQRLHRWEVAESYTAGGGSTQTSPLKIVREAGHTGHCHVCGRCGWYEPAEEPLKPTPKPEAAKVAATAASVMPAAPAGPWFWGFPG